MDQLGAALRAWRDRLDPATVGFAHGSLRRVPGLRRAELATLAGISVEYVVRLEQGRVATPSAQVCSALARALRLGELPRVRQTAAERAAFEESLVADLRATTSRYPDDPDLVIAAEPQPTVLRVVEPPSGGRSPECAQARPAPGCRYGALEFEQQV